MGESGRQHGRYWLLLREIVETIMIVLGFVWTALLILDLAYGLPPVGTIAFNAIWVIFILDFLVRLGFASGRAKYLRTNWLTAVSLAIPAIRILRIFRVLRVFRLLSATRGFRLVRLLVSLNYSIRALGRTMRRRGFGYVVLLTIVVVLAGAAGMYAFERNPPGVQGLESYSDALWWTAMIMTTMGSQYWPVTPEGRVLGFLLAVYAATVFGYITAILASYFIGRETAAKSSDAATRAVEDLRQEITALREELRAGGNRPTGQERDPGLSPGQD